MPWTAIPYGDFHIDEMKKKFGVTKLPHLIILRKDGTIIVENACQAVIEQGSGVFSSWEQNSY